MAGFFWKVVPEHNWPDDAETRAFIREKWHEPFGDMRQELVFICLLYTSPSPRDS